MAGTYEKGLQTRWLLHLPNIILAMTLTRSQARLN